MSHSVSFIPTMNVSQEDFSKPFTIKKKIFIAISIIMTIGMVVSYFLGAPWFVPATLFLLALTPLFPLGKPDHDLSGRIKE